MFYFIILIITVISSIKASAIQSIVSQVFVLYYQVVLCLILQPFFVHHNGALRRQRHQTSYVSSVEQGTQT
uniref:Uncharacterized protein n=1 Tax=Trichoplusia ni single nucleopolyhedrovirus TaxID=332054 RepID=A0A481V9V1_9ABAC|nr:hypothetical protein [Trichoplusia ni single nucleopolyhedrovirus]